MVIGIPGIFRGPDIGCRQTGHDDLTQTDMGGGKMKILKFSKIFMYFTETLL